VLTVNLVYQHGRYQSIAIINHLAPFPLKQPTTLLKTHAKSMSFMLHKMMSKMTRVTQKTHAHSLGMHAQKLNYTTNC